MSTQLLLWLTDALQAAADATTATADTVVIACDPATPARRRTRRSATSTAPQVLPSLWDDASAPEGESTPEPPELPGPDEPQHRTSHRGLPLFDPELTRCECPGCREPLPMCACCKRPAVVASLCSEDWPAKGEGHTVSWCQAHWDLLQSVRNRKTPPLVTVPVREARTRRRYGLSVAGAPDTPLVRSPDSDELPPLPVGEEPLAVTIA